MPPPLPEILKLNVPPTAFEVALNVSVLEVVPTGSDAGEKEAVTPEGKAFADSVTAELNPPLAVIFKALVTFDPVVTVKEAGVALS
jgi:hypothetical protein